MDYQAIFKRLEVKFMLTAQQAAQLKEVMSEYMQADAYGNSTVCNIYFDTPSFLLIRRSIEKPVYKEKLRLRSYGIANDNKQCFAELKIKYDSVVYKRRMDMPYRQAMDCLQGKQPLPDTQIGREIGFCLKRYGNLYPAMFLSYEREAFYAKDDSGFRITFDKNILWRTYDVQLNSGVYGTPLLDEGTVLLEVKTAGAIPLWLVKFFSQNKIYKTSFSKYGTAYRAFKEGKEQRRAYSA